MERSYETRDVAVRSVLLVGAAILGLTVVAFGGMWWLLGTLERAQARQSPPANPLAGSYGPTEPPAPRLQVRPLDDLLALRAEEQQYLSTYGWVDREQGIARIPIERAMELLAERSRRGAGRR